MKGIGRAYHAAALLSTIEGREQELFDSNVLGTRNLLLAAREAGVGRVVVTGSFSAVGHREDGPSDETVPFNPFDKAMPYEKSKAGVEHECLKAVVEGQDVVVATSCAILGPNDFKPSRMGRVVRDFANGRMLAYIPGGFEFVAARDIVSGHLLAMHKGRTGQKYIFSTRFCTVDDLMDILERVTERPRPRLRLPAPVMAMVSEVTQPIFRRLFPSSPQCTATPTPPRRAPRSAFSPPRSRMRCASSTSSSARAARLTSRGILSHMGLRLRRRRGPQQRGPTHEIVALVQPFPEEADRAHGARAARRAAFLGPRARVLAPSDRDAPSRL
jgi:nucleoside-diphosphate-sugar epimerase